MHSRVPSSASQDMFRRIAGHQKGRMMIELRVDTSCDFSSMISRSQAFKFPAIKYRSASLDVRCLSCVTSGLFHDAPASLTYPTCSVMLVLALRSAAAAAGVGPATVMLSRPLLSRSIAGQRTPPRIQYSYEYEYDM